MKLPIDGNDLWPSGKLLQLEWLNPGEIKRLSLRRRSYMIEMTLDEFAIVEKLERERHRAIQIGPIFYDFYGGPRRKVVSWSTKIITEVTLATARLTNFMCVWVRPSGKRSRKILMLESPPIGFPRTISNLVDAAQEGGLLGPDKSSARRVVFVREIERQFRRASPQAEIVLYGQQLSEETFRRIVH